MLLDILLFSLVVTFLLQDQVYKNAILIIELALFYIFLYNQQIPWQDKNQQ